MANHLITILENHVVLFLGLEEFHCATMECVKRRAPVEMGSKKVHRNADLDLEASKTTIMQRLAPSIVAHVCEVWNRVASEADACIQAKFASPSFGATVAIVED